MHLLPHCQESQERIRPLVGDYPLYLVLITLGYMLVLFVERVLFDVHGSAHGHGPHTGRATCVVGHLVQQRHPLPSVITVFHMYLAMYVTQVKYVCTTPSQVMDV